MVPSGKRLQKNIEHGPVEIVDLTMVVFHSYVSLPEGSRNYNPLVFWYQWDYLHSPAKNLFFCRVSKIGTEYQKTTMFQLFSCEAE